MVHFAKNSKFWSMDFLHFFPRRGKLVEKMIHQKKIRGHRTSKIVKSRQSSGNGHLPYDICLFYELARALMDDVACGFAHREPSHPFKIKERACFVFLAAMFIFRARGTCGLLVQSLEPRF